MSTSVANVTSVPPPEPLSVEAINRAVGDGFPGSKNRCVEIGDDWVLARLDPTADSIRPGGYLSGPSQFGLADAALWFLSFVAIDRIELMALTSELSIRFLRPAIGSTLWARATLDSVGSRTIVGTVHVWVDDNEAKPSSVAQGSYVLPRS